MREKAEMRGAADKQSAAWGADYLAASDRAIGARALALPEWEAANCLFCYVSVRREPDTRALLRAAFAAGKRVAVPLCFDGGRMEAREILSLEALVDGRYGLLEPAPEAALVRPDDIDLAVVPCVAADRRGFRLGHGAGYYDRYLETLRCPAACLCRARALVAAVPIEAHDAPVDMILTEDECLRFRRDS